jgi:predicted negative regulator of RcsB-dependent stress response
MSADDLERELHGLGRDLRPPDGWEERVFARIEAGAAPARRPTGWMLATAAMAVVATFAGWTAWSASDEASKTRKEAATQAERAQRLEDEMRRQVSAELEQIRDSEREIQETLAALQVAKDEHERAQMSVELAKVQQKKSNAVMRLKTFRELKKASKTLARCQDPNDPLCGI